MALGLDPSSVLVGILIAVGLFLLLDLVLAGGSLTAGIVEAAGSVVSVPWGWILLALVALLIAAQLAT